LCGDYEKPELQISCPAHRKQPWLKKPLNSISEREGVIKLNNSMIAIIIELNE